MMIGNRGGLSHKRILQEYKAVRFLDDVRNEQNQKAFIANTKRTKPKKKKR